MFAVSRQQGVAFILGARLRMKETMEHTLDDDFLSYTSAIWNRKGCRELAWSLIEKEVPFRELIATNFWQRAARVYQCELSEQFVDTKQLEQQIVLHKHYAKANLTIAAAQLSATEVMFVQCFKSLLELGSVFSLPRELLEAGRAVEGHAVVAVGGFDLKALLEQCPRTNDDIVVNGDITFFEVVNQYPERMVQATPSHVPRSRTTVRIRTFEVRASDDTSFAISPNTTGQEEIDVLPWCSEGLFPAVLSELLVWASLKHGSCVEASGSVDQRSASAIFDRERVHCEALSNPLRMAEVTQMQSRVVDHLVSRGAFCDKKLDAWLPFEAIGDVRWEVISRGKATAQRKQRQEEIAVCVSRVANSMAFLFVLRTWLVACVCCLWKANVLPPTLHPWPGDSANGRDGCRGVQQRRVRRARLLGELRELLHGPSHHGGKSTASLCRARLARGPCQRVQACCLAHARPAGLELRPRPRPHHPRLATSSTDKPTSRASCLL